MPATTDYATQTGLIARLIKDVRRLQRQGLNTLRDVDPTGLTDGASPTWNAAAEKYELVVPGAGGDTRVPKKDLWTVAATPATTYTLTALPLADSLNLSLNGIELEETVDYTVDDSIGVVTVSATLNGTGTADVLTADYLSTEALISSRIYDDFNRADSTTSLGTTSDGTSTWTAANGTWGISSNAAKMFGAIGDNDQAYIDTGASDGTLEIVLATLDSTGGARAGGQMFRWSDTANYFYIACENIAGATHITRVTGGGKLTLGSAFTTAPGDRVTVILSGGSITVQVNGTTVATASDTQNLTSTKHGLYCETQVTHFDSWSFIR